MCCSKNVIIHRDLKPANLMIAGVPFENGSREVAQKSGFVKIADFGLSRSLAINNPHSKTSAAKSMDDRCCPQYLLMHGHCFQRCICRMESWVNMSTVSRQLLGWTGTK